jgi:hypothetical protein
MRQSHDVSDSATLKMDTKHDAKQKACGTDDSSQFDDFNEIEYALKLVCMKCIATV